MRFSLYFLNKAILKFQVFREEGIRVGRLNVVYINNLRI